MGAMIGRYANRIAHGTLSIEGRDYVLPVNQPPHHLHGGHSGFDKKVWNIVPMVREDGVGLNCTYTSPDGEEGYPGTLYAHVHFFLSHSNSLVIHYMAKADAPTIVNLTHHPYFNLTGKCASALNQILILNSKQYLPITRDKIPTGQILPVAETSFDFCTARYVLDALDLSNEQILIAGGIDHCYVIEGNPEELRLAATLVEPFSGRTLGLYTTCPGVQLYTGNYLEGTGKNNTKIEPYHGIALEPQLFPDLPHHPEWGTACLKPGEIYTRSAIYSMSTIATGK
jgi:aldose 1-epimerase